MPSSLPVNLGIPKEPKKVEITVPDYEQKFREMYQKEQTVKAAKKKKKLIESIADEVRTYALLFVMGFVVFLVIYTLRKDKGPDVTPVGEQEKTKKAEATKKNIWDEDF